MWVAERPDPSSKNAAVIGFLTAEVIDRYLHVAQASVETAYQSKGAGRALMNTAEGYAKLNGMKGLSLITDRAALWNGPWYAKLGFKETRAEDVGEEHVEAWKQERQLDFLDGDRRCVMVKKLEQGRIMELVSCEGELLNLLISYLMGVFACRLSVSLSRKLVNLSELVGLLSG